MTLRQRSLVLVTLLVFWLAYFIGLGVIAFGQAGQTVQRIDSMHQRLESLIEVDGLAGGYSGKVAEVLLFGRAAMPALQTARLRLERAFAKLSQITRDQVSSLAGMEAIEDQLSEVEDTRRMLELYHAIDLSAARALVAQRDGGGAEALALFQRDVQFRIDNEFAALVQGGMQGERNKLTGQLAGAERTRTILLWLALGSAVLAVVSVGFAVTWLQRAREQQLRSAQAYEQLQAEMEGRTRQLQQANERLRGLDRRRAQFLADVSHELRTPLTILRGEADVALRVKADPAEQRQSLERIQGQAAELGQLLDDLISFARSDAEPQDLVLVETRLEDVIAAAAQEGETLAEPREVTIDLRLADATVHVDADFRRLKQAFIIGIDNAIKHSPPGASVSIVSGLDGDHVLVRIIDHGPGLAEGDEEHVFDRFYRGRNGGDPISGGLGIGLAIAKDIIERHGGSIAIGNGTETGAVLTITLPLRGASK
jgi:signal transduction histidine kinase